MSNRTRKSASGRFNRKVPRKAASQPTPAQKDAILERADKAIPVPTAPAKRKRGRPSNAEKAARLAASQPAPAGSNGDHPKTLPAVVASPRGFLLKIGEWACEAASVEEAQGFYLRERQLQTDVKPWPEGELFGPAGTKVARIDKKGRAYQMDGTQVGSFMKAPQSTDAPASEPLEPATVVTVPVKYLAAALAIAPKKDTRYYLNAVYLQQIGDSLRIVASDGHRMLVISTEQKKVLPWGEDGLLIPRDELERIVKFVGKTNGIGVGASLEISYGRKHPVIQLQAPADIARFTVNPVDGKFPDYVKVVQSAGDVIAAERNPTETSAVQSAYLKSAGAIAAQLESDAVFSFMGTSANQPCVFTFAGEPGALLYISPFKAGVQAVQAAAVQLIGEVGMARSIAALKAHETRCRKAAETASNKAEVDRLVGQANSFKSRQDELLGMLQAKLTGPTTDKPAQEEAGAQA